MRIKHHILCCACALLVTAFYGCGGGNSNPTTTVTSSSTIPPASIYASTYDETVAISWMPVKGITLYNVYLASQSGVTRNNYLQLPDGAKRFVSSDDSYIVQYITGLELSKTYYFIVASLDGASESTESNEVSATPHAAVVVSGNGTIKFQPIDWTCYMIVADGGTTYQAENLPKEYEIEGQRIYFEAKIREGYISQCAGTVIELTKIEKLPVQ